MTFDTARATMRASSDGRREEGHGNGLGLAHAQDAQRLRSASLGSRSSVASSDPVARIHAPRSSPLRRLQTPSCPAVIHTSFHRYPSSVASASCNVGDNAYIHLQNDTTPVLTSLRPPFIPGPAPSWRARRPCNSHARDGADASSLDGGAQPAATAPRPRGNPTCGIVRHCAGSCPICLVDGSGHRFAALILRAGRAARSLRLPTSHRIRPSHLFRLRQSHSSPVATSAYILQPPSHLCFCISTRPRAHIHIKLHCSSIHPVTPLTLILRPTTLCILLSQQRHAHDPHDINSISLHPRSTLVAVPDRNN
ncbi:hypothetical protein V8E36_006921 [Tilletia maclaganii]